MEQTSDTPLRSARALLGAIGVGVGDRSRGLCGEHEQDLLVLAGELGTALLADEVEAADARPRSYRMVTKSWGAPVSSKMAMAPQRAPVSARGPPVSSRKDVTAPAGAEHNTLYVAVEISRKSWMVGIKSPTSERIGLYSLGP